VSGRKLGKGKKPREKKAGTKEDAARRRPSCHRQNRAACHSGKPERAESGGSNGAFSGHGGNSLPVEREVLVGQGRIRRENFREKN